MKTIFYILSILVIAASGYFAFSNSKKIEEQIALFDDTRNTKRQVEASITKTEKDLEDTTAALEEAKANNSNLTANLENEKSKETAARKSIEKYEAEIADHDAELAKLGELEATIKAKLGPIRFEEIGPKIKALQEESKEKGKKLDDLNVIVAELTKDIAEKRAEHARQTGELSEIHRRIALNAKAGAVTVVDSTWGFVVVNLGANNSNVTMQSTLLVTRGGRLMGRLKPNSVEPNQTVCDLNARDITPGVRIQPGDKVTIADTVAGR